MKLTKQKLAFDELDSIMEVISLEMQSTIIGGIEWTFDGAGNAYYREYTGDPWTRWQSLNEVRIIGNQGYVFGSSGNTNWGGNPWQGNPLGGSGGAPGTSGSPNGSTLPYGPELIAKSNLVSSGAFSGYISLFMTKNASLLYYTAQDATKLADIANSLRATKVLVVSGKIFGGIGTLINGVEDAIDGDGFTWGDAAKAGIGIVSTLTPYGWAFSVVDLATGIITGQTITDRVGDYIDN